MEDISKELQLEADKYLDKKSDSDGFWDCFIAGATSKYVQKEKLKFAIEQLKKASMLIVSQHERKANMRVIIELEQQLKQLENE